MRSPSGESLEGAIGTSAGAVYLATGEDLPGLVAQGHTIQDTLDITRDVGRKLKKLFSFDCQAAGSHEIGYNPKTDRYTTLPNNLGDLPEGTLRAILKQADIPPDEFLAA